MKSFTVLIAAALLIATIGCSKKNPAPVQEPASTAVPFTPFGSGQVSSLQVEFWLKTNRSLDSLLSINMSVQDTKDSIQNNQFLNNYTKQREKVCKSNGLSGGYSEYLWISKNISRAVNRPLLDSLDLQTL